MDVNTKGKEHRIVRSVLIYLWALQKINEPRTYLDIVDGLVAKLRRIVSVVNKIGKIIAPIN